MVNMGKGEKHGQDTGIGGKRRMEDLISQSRWPLSCTSLSSLLGPGGGGGREQKSF